MVGLFRVPRWKTGVIISLLCSKSYESPRSPETLWNAIRERRGQVRRMHQRVLESLNETPMKHGDSGRAALLHQSVAS
jgi:hypothetical protein